MGLNPTEIKPDANYKVTVSKNYATDDQALAVFLRGAFLREAGENEEAQKWLMICVKNWTESSLEGETTYVMPGSWIELAHIAFDENNLKLAKSYLEEARTFKQYHNVSRMQFRIHALQQEISKLDPTSSKHKKGLEVVTNRNTLHHSKTSPSQLSAK